MKKQLKNILTISKTAFKEWWAKDPFKESAAIAYYAIFSLPGLLVVIITVAGYFFGQEVVNRQIASQITSTMGADTAQQIQDIIEKGKPIAAICHAGSLLIETGFLKGKQMTSYKSIKTDLINAGVNWKDEEVVVDNKLITSRCPKDLPAFCKKMIEELT